MPIPRATVEAHVARLNALRRTDEPIVIAMLEADKVHTGIQSGRQDDAGRYWIEYDEIVWD